MDPLIGSSIIGGIASLLGAGGSAVANTEAVKEANRGNMELAEYQYSKNLEMWERQNAYNTPLEQRKRAEAAGLNPNLLYGHGSLSNTAAPAPSYQAPTLQAYTGIPNIVESGINALNSFMATRAEVDLKRSQAAKNISETVGQDIGNKILERFGMEDAALNNAMKRFQAQLEDRRSRYYDDLAKAERDKNISVVDHIKAEIEKINSTIVLLKAQTTTEGFKQENLVSSTELNKANVPLVKAKTRLTDASTRTELFKPAVMSADITFKNAIAEAQSQLSGKLGAETYALLVKNQYIEDLSEAEVNQALGRVAEIGAHVGLLTQQAELTRKQAELVMKQQLKADKELKYMDAEAISKIATMWVNSLSNAVGTLHPVKPK